jgi:hypothetical protein
LGRRAPDKSAFDRARDELFSHIHRCDVLGAGENEQREWLNDTLKFMGQRYPELSPTELRQLEELGVRFCKPPIPHGQEHTAESKEDANAA